MLHSIPHERRAFTLIEMIVVMVIILVLIAIFVPVLSRARAASKVTTARAQLQNLQSALQTYFADHDTYPPSHLPSASPNYGPITRGMGSVMLAQGLMGFAYAPVDGAGPADASDTASEEKPNFGFRTRKNLASASMGRGKIFGAYTDPSRKGYVRSKPGEVEYFEDVWGHDILYYRGGRGPVAGPPGSNMVFDNSEAIVQSIFFSDDNSKTQKPSRYIDRNGRALDQKSIAEGVDPKAYAADTELSPQFLKFEKNIYPSPTTTSGRTANRYTGGQVMGSDSFLLISAGTDEGYFTGDDLVISKP